MAGQGAAAPVSTPAPAKHGGNLFARARAYAPLTPGERALLRLIEGLVCAALVAALPVIADALGHGSVRWVDVSRTALAAAAVAVLLALAKYAHAQGDPALGTAIEAVAGALTAPRSTPNPATSDATGDNGVASTAAAHVTLSTTGEGVDVAV